MMFFQKGSKKVFLSNMTIFGIYVTFQDGKYPMMDKGWEVDNKQR